MTSLVRSDLECLSEPQPAGVTPFTRYAEDLLPSKIPQLDAYLDDLADRADPVTAAIEFARLQRSSAETVILACRFANRVMRRYSANKDNFKEFVQRLANERIISSNDARVGLAGPSKLSMIRKIGSCAGVLLRNEILRLLPPGYSVLYQVVGLYETLEGDEEARVDALSGILQLCDGPLTREYLIQAIGLRKSGNSDPQTPGQDPLSALPAADSPHFIGVKASLILLTPTAADIRLIAENYSDPTTLSRCLPLADAIDAGAVAIVASRLRDLPAIAQNLLPCCGFAGFSHVLLAREPAEPDVAAAQVLIIAKRGNHPDVQNLDTWSADEGHPIASVASAEWLVPSANRRLHVFASAESDNWECLSSDSTWAERPSLR